MREDQGSAAGLLERLPHRPPFRFLTRVVSMEAGVEGRAEWELTGEEDFFRGHFPGRPVVPGVLIGEAMAQLAGLVGLHTGGPGGGGRLVHMDTRFDQSVEPPAVLAVSARLTREFGPLKQFEVMAECRGARVARGMLTLAEVVEGGGA